MKKLNTLLAIGIIFLAMSSISASVWIYSNWVIGEVKPKPTLTLQSSQTSIFEGDNFTLTAILNPTMSGVSIIFYWNETNLIGTNSTDFLGVASIIFTPIIIGYYNFTAKCLVS